MCEQSQLKKLMTHLWLYRSIYQQKMIPKDAFFSSEGLLFPMLSKQSKIAIFVIKSFLARCYLNISHINAFGKYVTKLKAEFLYSESKI